jgi:hypothetical protein
LKPRFFAAALLAFRLHAATQTVEFPFDRIPKHLWARELVWIKNLGLTAVDVPAEPANATRISVLSPDALIKSRRATGDVIWTDVESQVTPVFHAGGVSLAGDEDPALQVLRREVLVRNYWGGVLEAEDVSVANTLPDTVTVKQRAIPEASAVSIINTGKKDWTGEVHVALPSFKHTIRIPGVMVDARDALLLPVDVAFADPRFCRFCSGMSNSERLLYATAELTAIEYENGILSFEFYAPHAGVAVLQLEREPAGPMLAAGHPMAFDWDAENKRAKLPIPAGKGAGKRVRIAVTMTAPDHVASFVNVHVMVIGETNHVMTDYSSDAFAKRSRLIGPAGWKINGEVKSPTQTEYAIDVPKDRLHGEHEELRLEADGIGMSHVRVQLLRPVSVHVAEAAALHFGSAAEMTADPPVVPVEGPNGRNFSIQLRNNAPEIRNFQVSVASDELEFSPEKVDISIGASMEREIPMRVFVKNAGPGLHEAKIKIGGAANAEQTVRFLVIPRGGSVNYQADLLDVGTAQQVWENDRIRAVIAGQRWIEFYWKESGRSLLPPEGVALSGPATVELQGNELTLDGIVGLPRGGTVENVTWKAETVGAKTKYTVTETKGK